MASKYIRSTDNPKLKEKLLSSGQISLYLEYYLGYSTVYDEKKDKEVAKAIRKKETLNLYLHSKPRTPIEREENRQTIELAKKLRNEREQQMKEDIHGYRINKTEGLNFFDYYQAFYNNHTKKDKRMIKGSMERFRSFIAEEYPLYINFLKPKQINPEMVTKFVDYLKSKGEGEGPHDYYKKFKKVIKRAYEEGIIRKNPTTGIACSTDRDTLRKSVLSMDEIRLLITSSYPEQNKEIRRAFLFCLYTGIRFCDVKELKYSNVDFANKRLRFEQTKTRGHSSKSQVNNPINETIINLIGYPEVDEAGDIIDGFIFNLPSHTACLKSLRVWTKKAGITKHITWHCARHSFAVNILNNGANIKTVSDLLGHSSIKMTEKYLHVVDKLKDEAINSLPEMDF